MNQLKLVTILSLFSLFAFFSCEKNNDFNPNAKGELIISISSEEILTNSKNQKEFNAPAAVLISVKNNLGENIYSKKRVELYNFNNKFLSTPISLTAGNYELTSFMVIDNANNVLYVTPKEGSENAYLVNNPLNIEFTIRENETEKITPEVISIQNLSPESFGYSTFSFDIVETLNFLTAVFIYDTNQQNFELTDAKMIITNNSDTLYNKQLGAITNLITINSTYDTYDIEISKPGFEPFNTILSKDSLEKHFSVPLTVILNNDCQVLILQPGAINGKDSYIESYDYDDYNNRNFGSHPEFTCIAWTSGTPCYVRSLIDFNLSDVPVGANIIEAKLFLYAADNTVNGPGHSQLSGSNECLLQRITADWEELTVTWNTQPTTTTANQIVLAASESSMQDYEIEITDHIKDMIANPNTKHGFMLRLQNENYYRRMMFASSDNPDSTKWPKLVIKFK